MSLSTLLLILLLLAAVWWLIRMRRAGVTDKTSTSEEPRKKKTAYHAVSIKYSADSCSAAKALAGQRFLATAAPTLPLPDCDAAACQCRFAHHDDRRSGRDRRSPFARGGMPGGTGAFEREQRAAKDRRQGDGG
ncbi:hypothetical protein GWP57_12440 [Gammaproteobacteria bacterium]|nr:hypothetical protein [Gammaproteobacteria bacterium]